MKKKTRNTKYGTELGATVSMALVKRRLIQDDLAGATNLSLPYTNHIITGRKPIPNGWLELVSSNLKLTADEKQELYKAAAKTQALDLTKK